MHLTRQVPSPIHAAVLLLPRDQIVEEGEVPDPVLTALVHLLVLEKERTLTAKERHEAPKEEQSEDVEGPKSDEAIENEQEFVGRQLAIVELHLDEELVGGEEGRDPEEDVDKEVCRQDNAEERALYPLLDHLNVLDGAAERVEI